MDGQVVGGVESNTEYLVVGLPCPQQAVASVRPPGDQTRPEGFARTGRYVVPPRGEQPLGVVVRTAYWLGEE